MPELGDLDARPRFVRGDRVAANRLVRNDGTFPGAAVGQVLIEPGAVGYVRSIGTHLNRYYVYGVDFVAAGLLVGMRQAELEAAPEGEDR
jgi:nitrogen fixation protein NifZ